MYVGKDYDPIEAGETDVFSLEFTDDLKSGRTIGAPVWSCIVIRTDVGATPDNSPSARIDGVATISTSIKPISGALRTFANQKVNGMIAGNLYALQATVTTSDGCTLQRYSRVYCQAVK